MSFFFFLFFYFLLMFYIQVALSVSPRKSIFHFIDAVLSVSIPLCLSVSPSVFVCLSVALSLPIFISLSSSLSLSPPPSPLTHPPRLFPAEIHTITGQKALCCLNKVADNLVTPNSILWATSCPRLDEKKEKWPPTKLEGRDYNSVRTVCFNGHNNSPFLLKGRKEEGKRGEGRREGVRGRGGGGKSYTPAPTSSNQLKRKRQARNG